MVEDLGNCIKYYNINIKNQLLLSMLISKMNFVGGKKEKRELEKTCLFFFMKIDFISCCFLDRTFIITLVLFLFIPFDKNLTFASAIAAAMISTNLTRTQIHVKLTQQCDFWRLSRRKTSFSSAK